MWHNHVDNIVRAKEFIDALDEIYSDGEHLDALQANALRELFKSMIADAEAGHARIEQLELEKKDLHERLCRLSSDNLGCSRIFLRCALHDILKICDSSLEKDIEIFNKPEEVDACQK